MILMFNKKTLEGHWFKNGESSEGYTEKVPPFTNYVFDENKNEWVLPERIIENDEAEND